MWLKASLRHHRKGQATEGCADGNGAREKMMKKFQRAFFIDDATHSHTLYLTEKAIVLLALLYTSCITFIL